VDKQLANGENIIFDVDVNGAMNIKKLYGKRALSIFIQPPSIEELRDRLEKRATDAPEVIAQRVERAKYELEQAEHFDEVVINDNHEVAKVEARALVEDFLAD
jgi:guanylate kinase